MMLEKRKGLSNAPVQLAGLCDKLLFVWPGLKWILEIGPGGLVRSVPVHVPEGFVIDHFVPSDKLWYVSFRKYGADSNADMETTLYEINPSDGMPTRRFETAPEYVTGIGCEQDGEFRAMGFHAGHIKTAQGDAAKLVFPSYPRNAGVIKAGRQTRSHEGKRIPSPTRTVEPTPLGSGAQVLYLKDDEPSPPASD